MDSKTARRTFYKNKIYLSSKHDEEYSSEKLQQDLKYLLDEYLPKANLKQLKKFMSKKFERLVKKYPAIKQAVKKVLEIKLNRMPEQYKKTQRQKILACIRQNLPNMELKEIEDGFELCPIKDSVGNVKHFRYYQIESSQLRVPKGFTQFMLETSKDEKINHKFFFLRFNTEVQPLVVKFSKTEELQNLKLQVKNGNFTRKAEDLLDQFDAFEQKMFIIQTK